MTGSPFPAVDLDLMPEEQYAPLKREALGNLGVLHGMGEIDRDEFDEWREMLDLTEPATVTDISHARAISRRSKGRGATA